MCGDNTKEDVAGKWRSSLRRLRATRDRECRELQDAIECTNERPQKARVRDGTQTEVVERCPRISGSHAKKIMVLDDRIKADELDVLEKTQAMEELLQERNRSGGVERYSCC